MKEDTGHEPLATEWVEIAQRIEAEKQRLARRIRRQRYFHIGMGTLAILTFVWWLRA